MIASWIIFNTDSKYKLLTGLLITIGIIVLSIFLEVSPKQMGIEMGSFKQGALTALPFMLTIVGVMGIAYLFKPTIFLDSRYDQSLSAMLVSILILLPLTTVLLEELFFRGLFFGYLNNVASQLTAIIISSLAFGLWHFYTSKSVTLDGISISPVLLSVGVIIVTAIAGAFFTWLRIRGNNLITPVLVHWTINATGVVLSYLAWHR
jgi:membrane protease YdiL (CAAX protease family)